MLPVLPLKEVLRNAGSPFASATLASGENPLSDTTLTARAARSMTSENCVRKLL
jgi:hypothetical protein